MHDSTAKRSALVVLLTLLLAAPAAVTAGPSPQSQYRHLKWVPEAGVKCFTVVAPGQPTGPRVAAGRQVLRLSYGTGDVVYIDEPGGTMSVGDTFEVVRSSGTVAHPHTGDELGVALEILGVSEVIDVNSDEALVRIESSCREIEIGDYLRPRQEIELPEVTDLPPFEADRLVQVSESDATVALGTVESVASDPTGTSRLSLLAQETYAQGDLVTIDQGSGQGWSAGDLTLFYRGEPDRLYRTGGVAQPPLVVGRGLVVRADGASSTVLITDGDFEVQIGHRARNLGPAPASAAGGPAAADTLGNQPPSLSCDMERARVRRGESVRISAEVDDPDGDETTLSWTASSGTVVPAEGASVTWEGADASTGIVTITGTAADSMASTTCVLALTVGPPPEPAQPTTLNFNCVDFASGRVTLDNRCKAVLDDVALQLRQNPRATATITGHTDTTGSAEANRTASEQRAMNAESYLVETHGIDASRINASGVGSSEPIAGNDTEEGRARNRRIEVVVIVPPGPPSDR